jgi:hypothetical protein
MQFISLLVFLVSFTAYAAAPATQAAPSATPNFCDQAFSSVTEDADHNLVSIAPPFVQYAVPYADVVDNHKKQEKVLAELAKQQNKGGEYTITVTETNTCDGGPTVRVASGSAYVEGVTLAGSVAVADVGIGIAKEVNDRYRDRAAKGAKTGWNHKNAAKVNRDDTGNVLPPGQAKKNQ